jgi:hypothetical protein
MQISCRCRKIDKARSRVNLPAVDCFEFSLFKIKGLSNQFDCDGLAGL